MNQFQKLNILHNKGLTLVEILITVAILGIIAAVTVSALPAFQKGVELDAAATRAAQALSEARGQTLSSRNAMQYGVHFQETGFVTFTGDSYTAGAPDNEETMLPGSVTVADISLAGGGADVVFKRLTGETDMYGTVTLQLASDAGKQAVIRIEQSGVVSVE